LNKLIKTSDGSHTIYVADLNEHYHSIHGAVQESSIVYIANGLGFSDVDPVNILEVGFGTGLNALLTAVSGFSRNRKIVYTSIEKYPLPESLVRNINHWSYAGAEGKTIFDKIHSAGWGKTEEITSDFFLRKLESDLTVDVIEGKFNLIYFDAFGPEKQPEMWSDSVIRKISEATERGGIFVTYSAKGEVRRLLKAHGFKVTMLPGPPGKREMIRAIKQ
jgi:tRNA U34 5-methylaminomethyl-2-thiouridine-forming methyltransferase MnmC